VYRDDEAVTSFLDRSLLPLRCQEASSFMFAPSPSPPAGARRPRHSVGDMYPPETPRSLIIGGVLRIGLDPCPDAADPDSVDACSSNEPAFRPWVRS